MAVTSGSTSFNLDLTELVEEAFERAGGELRTGYDLRTARRSLNIMFAEWANRGINMWTIETGVIDLVAGQSTYALPNDTVDLIEHVIRTQANNTSNQADLTITRISVSTYATLPQQTPAGPPNSGVGAASGWPDCGPDYHVEWRHFLYRHHNYVDLNCRYARFGLRADRLRNDQLWLYRRQHAQ